MLLVIIAVLLLSNVDEAQSRYKRRNLIGGSLRIYESAVSWDEARHQCRSDGADLASPITLGLLKELRTFLQNTFYFIGVDARFHNNTFVSVEGNPIDEMPVSEMYDSLELDNGECLSMNQREIRVVQCTSRMPYVCFRNETDHDINASCKPPGYKYYDSTGAYYKLHVVPKSWYDAKAACKAEGAHLLVVDDAEEEEIVKKIITSFVKQPLYTGIWYSFGVHGNWKTDTGKRLDEVYCKWRRPLETCYFDCCAVIYSSGELEQDFSCLTRRLFICEL